MGSKTRAGFGAEEKGFRWGIFILLVVLYALFLNPRCWPQEQNSGFRIQDPGRAGFQPLPFTLLTYRANPYAEAKLKVLALADPAPGPAPAGQAAGPEHADQVLLSVYDAPNGALKANATLAGGTTNPTPRNADQVFLAIYDSTTGTIRINIVAGSITDPQLASSYSGVGACSANTWASTLNKNASPTCTRPAISNLTATISSPLVLNSNTLSIQQANGSQSGYLLSGDWTTFNSKQAALTFNSPLQNSSNAISCPTCEATTNKNASNGYAGLSGGLLSASQLPAPTASTLGGIKSLAATSHQWINSISTSGVPAASQPAIGDISGSYGGDLSGTIATNTPTVAKVNGAAVPASAALLNSNGSSQLGAVTTLPTSTFPALSGDVTNTAGSLATTVGKVTGAAVPAGKAVLGSNSASQLVQSTNVYTLTDYGADPTGTADSTTAEQAAITAACVTGGIVYYPAGTYKTTSELTVSCANVELRGPGVSAIIRESGNFNPLISITGTGDTVSNLEIDATAQTSATGSYIDAVQSTGDKFTIHDVTVLGSASDTVASGQVKLAGTNAYAYHNVFNQTGGYTNNQVYGLEVDGNNSIARDNTFLNFNCGLGIYGPSGVSAIGNRFLSVLNPTGAVLAGFDPLNVLGTNIMIAHNLVLASREHGIYVIGGSGISVVDNEFTGWQADAVALHESSTSNVTVARNLIHDPGTVGTNAGGIDIEAPTSVSITNVLVTDNSIWASSGNTSFAFGIFLTGVQQATVSRNVIANMQGAGINVRDVDLTLSGLVLDSNHIYSSGKSTSNPYGIWVLPNGGGTLTNVTVSNNELSDYQGTPTQAYGVVLSTPTNSTVASNFNVYGNYGTGNTSALYSFGTGYTGSNNFGVFPASFLPTLPASITNPGHNFLTTYTASTGAFTQGQPSCSDLSNAAASCSTDATVAGNITSGTLSAARLPDVPATTSSTGSYVLNWVTYTSGPSVTGSAGAACALTSFNGDSASATGTIALTATNTIAAGTLAVITNRGSFTTAPTSATISSSGGCSVSSGSAVIASSIGVSVSDPGGASAYQVCNYAGGCIFLAPSAPATSSGSVQRCYWNQAGQSGAITVQMYSGNYVDLFGATGNSGGYLYSGGAVGDTACIVSYTTDYWKAFTSSGAWGKY
jgi:hypothetical protein